MTPPLARAPRARRLPATLLTVLGLGGCGGADQRPPEAGVQPTPPGSDVWIADLHSEASGPPAIGAPVNVTRRAGYDNQPQWLPDGSGFWYTAVDEHQDQADIWRYDLEARRVTRVTASAPESEYSATPLPDGTGISVVRVEADSTQRLWRFDFEGGSAAVILEDVAPVGYHAWSDERTLVLFVLGDPATLRRADVSDGSVTVIAEDVGRSIQRMPESADVSFVQRRPDGTSTVMRLRPDSDEPEPLIEAVAGVDFHAWAPDGTLLMADGPVIRAWTPGVTDGWIAVADLSSLRIDVTRLAVSPDGSQIALVGEPAF